MFTHKQLRLAYIAIMSLLCICAAIYFIHFFTGKKKTLLIEDWTQSSMTVNVEYTAKYYTLQFENQDGIQAPFTVTHSGRFATYILDTSVAPDSTWYAMRGALDGAFTFAIY